MLDAILAKSANEFTIDDLLVLVKRNNQNANLDKIKEAYEFAKNAHRGQLRASGDPYILHPLITARNLAEINMPEEVIIAGLVHDVPEDTEHDLTEIEKLFGEDVKNLVEGITKLGKIKYRGFERYVENLRKMILAMAKDVRVIIIKCADRIHNLTTLEALPPDKQQRIAKESLEIFAPIANRLGIIKFQAQLELLAFKYVYPEEYNWVMSIYQDKDTEKKQEQMEVDIKQIEESFQKNGLKYLEIYGRSKHPYSLYRKLLKNYRDINRIYDLIAMRVIVPTIADCYMAMGLVHQLWKPLTGRVKDYIAQPKVNGYQSLHTTVFDNTGMITEIQIRTPEMHENAELGIAAHWIYNESKDPNKQNELKNKQHSWLQELKKWQQDIKNDPEAIKNMKLEMFSNRCFVFTPRGDVIELPEDATPVDFAYNIHTDIGNKCEGAYVNGKYVPLDTKLKNGDIIEIAINKNRKSPNQAWLKFVKTKIARSQIKQADKKSSFLSFNIFKKSKKEDK